MESVSKSVLGAKPFGRSTALVGGCVLLWLSLHGCIDTSIISDGCSPRDGNVSSAATLLSGKRVGEPNDTYSQALDLVLDDTGTGQIQGSICSVGDIDIYNLGPMSPGDRIRVDLHGQNGLDAAIAIFDDGGRIFVENDDRAPGDLAPFVNEVVRHEGVNYYLAVAASTLASSLVRGSYTAVIMIGRGEPVPAPKAQPLVLNFTGGSITIPGDRTYAVGPFDAADIDPGYIGQTSVVKRWIIQTVEENYAGVALEVYNTDTRPAPAGVPVSVVYFGLSNSEAYGISQDVDSYNHNQSDSSIVFTDDFAPSRFGRRLTSMELGRAIGNIASHEVGHLIGLNHVDNVADIMDTTGGPETFLGDQTFQASLLDWTIWPFGIQDGALLLDETLGEGQ